MAGWAPVLCVTPYPAHGLPDHHTLAFVNIATGMRHEDAPPLPDEITAVLIRAMTATDNPHRKPRP